MTELFITRTRLTRAEWMRSGECINGSIARPKVATRMAVSGGAVTMSMGKVRQTPNAQPTPPKQWLRRPERRTSNAEFRKKTASEKKTQRKTAALECCKVRCPQRKNRYRVRYCQL